MIRMEVGKTMETEFGNFQIQNFWGLHKEFITSILSFFLLSPLSPSAMHDRSGSFYSTTAVALTAGSSGHEESDLKWKLSFSKNVNHFKKVEKHWISATRKNDYTFFCGAGRK